LFFHKKALILHSPKNRYFAKTINIILYTMYLNTEKKQEIFEQFGIEKSKKDTGSAEAQIALFTHRINHLTQHLKQHKKDYSTRLGLLRLVGKRRKLLNYLQKKDINRYRAIIAALNLRK